MRRAARVGVVSVLVLFGLGCGAEGGGDGGEAGLATVFDSTRADTIIARTAGTVPDAAVRHLVETVRIAPEADDTSLFGDVYEFDVGPDGRLYVFDETGHTIFLFNADGTLRRRIGRQGAGPGEFNSNNGMAVLPDGHFVQFDARNGRLSFFTADGDFETGWVVTTGFYTSNGIITDRSGALYLYRPVTAPREGEILGRFGLVRIPGSGAFGDSLVAPDLPVDRIVYVARREGSMSASNAAHSARFHWAWHPDGYFVSANGGAYAIESSRPGHALRIVRDAPVVPVSPAEQAFERERVTASMRGLDPAWSFPGPDITAKAPVVAVLPTRDGRIWVQVAAASEEIPEAERDPQRPDRPPVARYRQAVIFEAFEPDGRFVGRVVFPRGARLMQADGNDVWYLTRDADGLPAVVRARVEPALR